MLHVPCELCGSDERETVLERDGWRLVRCPRCRFVYLDPRPGLDEIARDYDWFRHAPLQTGARRRRESPLRRLLRRVRGRGVLRRRSRDRVVLARIRKLVPRGCFLDVGCGDGYMVAAMADAGYDACGLDISEVAVRRARERGCTGVRQGTVHDAPFEPASFDAVLLMSYLEHEHRPGAALRRVRELLRPGGHVFVKVPHYGSWNRRVMGRRWCGYFFPQHLSYFTPDTLARLAHQCALEVVRNGFWDHVPVSDVLWLTARRP